VDYEKLGVFYLGRTVGGTREPLLYDAKDLTTHAVIVGMTGSGKTGLGIGLIEEAAIDAIPTIAIDPKGDLGNLLLNFPDLSPAQFEPWVEEGLTGAQAAERWTKDRLVNAMLGRALLKPPPEPRTTAAEEVLRVERLSVPGAPEEISFRLRRGEIVGLAGLVGSGRTSLLRALAGADSGAVGRLVVRGRERPWPRSVRSALRSGIALAPEERSQGLVASLSAAANVWLTDMAAVASGPMRRDRLRLRRAAETMGPLDFDVRRLREPAGAFSGGSQQKLVVGKWLHRRPAVLLMDEFVRGIDVGAKAQMLAVVTRLAARGMSIIVVSSELEELVDVADRVLVLARGRLIGELDGAEASVDRILRLVFDVEAAAEKGPAA